MYEKDQADKINRSLASYREQNRRLQVIAQQEQLGKLSTSEEYLLEKLLLNDVLEWKKEHDKLKRKDEPSEEEAEAKRQKPLAVSENEMHTTYSLIWY